MASKWHVEVNLSNGKTLSIGDNYVSGSTELVEEDEHLIREAAKSLLAFVGEFPNEVNAPASIRIGDAWQCTTCGKIYIGYMNANSCCQ